MTTPALSSCAMESIECQVFRHKLPDLLTGIQDRFVFSLYSKGLISPEILREALSLRSPQDQRTASVLTALENRVITRPEDFHAIVQILGASPHLKHLAEALTVEYQRSSELGPRPRLGLASGYDQRVDTSDPRAVVHALARQVEPGNALHSVRVPVQSPLPVSLTKDFTSLSVGTPNSPSPSRVLASYVSGGPLYQQRSSIVEATAVTNAECSQLVSSEEKQHSVCKQQAEIYDDIPDVCPQTVVEHESQMFAALSVPEISLSRLPPLSSHSLTPPAKSERNFMSEMIETLVDGKIGEVSDSLKLLYIEIESYYAEFQAKESLELKDKCELQAKESLELKEQCEQLQLKEKENAAEMKHLQRKLSESESTVRELTHTVSTLTKLLDQKSTEVQKKEDDEEEEVQSLREELNRARVELQQKEKKINELEGTVQGLRRQLDKVNRRRKSLSCPEFGSL